MTTNNLNAEIGNDIIKKLISNSICEMDDIVSMPLKIKLNKLNGYVGNFFANKENFCFLRYFPESPCLVAILCEYVYDDNDYQAVKLETFLKRKLKRIGLTSINLSTS